MALEALFASQLVEAFDHEKISKLAVLDLNVIKLT